MNGHSHCEDCRYKKMIDEANKYRKENKDYANKCEDVNLLHILLGCQTIEVREMKEQLEKFKERK